MGLGPPFLANSTRHAEKLSKFSCEGLVSLGMKWTCSCCWKWWCVSLKLKSVAGALFVFVGLLFVVALVFMRINCRSVWSSYGVFDFIQQNFNLFPEVALTRCMHDHKNHTVQTATLLCCVCVDLVCVARLSLSEDAQFGSTQCRCCCVVRC